MIPIRISLDTNDVSYGSVNTSSEPMKCLIDLSHEDAFLNSQATPLFLTNQFYLRWLTINDVPPNSRLEIDFATNNRHDIPF